LAFGLTKLQSLDLENALVSNAAVEKLRRAWPNCTILHWNRRP
jgi:hypothetical protein